MPHHGSEGPDITPELMEQLRLGATGKFPQGALNKYDEGELRFAITEQDGKVCIHFGKAVAWIGFDPIQAMELAALIRKRALQACAGKLSPEEAALLVQGNETIEIGADGKATIVPADSAQGRTPGKKRALPLMSIWRRRARRQHEG